MLPFMLWAVCLFPTHGSFQWDAGVGDAATHAWPRPAMNFETRCPLAAFVHIYCGQALKKAWNCLVFVAWFLSGKAGQQDPFLGFLQRGSVGIMWNDVTPQHLV